MTRPRQVILLSSWLAAAAAGACQRSPEPGQPAQNDAYRHPGPAHSGPEYPRGDCARWSPCDDSVELAYMHAAPVPVERTGLRLRIARASDPIELEDDTVEHDGFVRYRYRGYVVPLHAHLVQVGFHEGSRFHLIPDGRGKTEIASDPLLSPSGRRFATAVSNLPVNYDPNGIQVWDMKGSVPVLRLGVGGEEWGASAVMWVDENTLEFTRDSLDATLRPVPRRMRLVLDAAGFRMEPVR